MRAYRSTVEQILSEESGQAEVTIHIPDNMVAFVIGKGGRQIVKLQSRSNTEICLLQQISEIRERQVRIKGRLNDTHQAVEDLYLFVLSYSLGRKKAGPNCYSAKFIIPSSSTGYIIGRRGAFTKYFRNECKVDIKVMEGQCPPCQEGESVLNVLGRLKDCYYAVEELLTHISNAIRNTSDAPPKEETKLLISTEFAGVLMAADGALLKRIGAKSRATLSIANETEISSDRTALVLISGYFEQRVEAVKRLLLEIENLSRHQDRSRENRSPRREHRSPKHDPQAPTKTRETTKDNDRRSDTRQRRSRDDSQEHHDSHERQRRRSNDISAGSLSSSPRTDVSMTVPDELVGRLIGRSGDNIKSLMEKCRCNIKFEKSPCRDLKTPEGGTARLCTFTGTTSKVATGVKILLENIAKLENERRHFECRGR
jgi:transcription antitermination factor NusA-like protein